MGSVQWLRHAGNRAREPARPLQLQAPQNPATLENPPHGPLPKDRSPALAPILPCRTPHNANECLTGLVLLFYALNAPVSSVPQLVGGPYGVSFQGALVDEGVLTGCPYKVRQLMGVISGVLMGHIS